MSNSFTKNVTLYSTTAEAQMTWNFQIDDSALSGTASYLPNGGTSVEFKNLSGTVQFRGGYPNGPFTIDVTGGKDSFGESISAALSVDADWASGEGGFTITEALGAMINAPTDTPISNQK